MTLWQAYLIGLLTVPAVAIFGGAGLLFVALFRMRGGPVGRVN